MYVLKDQLRLRYKSKVSGGGGGGGGGQSTSGEVKCLEPKIYSYELVCDYRCIFAELMTSLNGGSESREFPFLSFRWRLRRSKLV